MLIKYIKNLIKIEIRFLRASINNILYSSIITNVRYLNTLEPFKIHLVNSFLYQSTSL